MKLLEHPLVTAVPLSMFCSLSLVAALVSPEHIWVYHHDGSPTPVFAAVLVNLVLSWAAIALVLILFGRRRKLQVVLWTTMVVLLPLEWVQQATYMQVWRPSHQLKVAFLFVAAGLWAALLLLWQKLPANAFQRFRSMMATVLGFAAIGCGVTVVQLLWCFDRALAIEQTPVLHSERIPATHRTGQHQRVIWIVLDELSYRQVYGHRYPGLELPEFDRLARESVVFTDVVPAADKTRIALPAMFTGRPLSGIRASASGNEVALYPPAGRPFNLNPKDTIFGDALALGDTTGIAGWYNPYCRLLGPVLDRCFWAMGDFFSEGMQSNGSILENAIGPWKIAAERPLKLAGAGRGSPDSSQQKGLEEIVQDRDARINDYKRLVAQGDDLLRSPEIDFAFLHMPFPHPPGFYDRKTGQLTDQPATYIDNLALADAYVGHIRQLLTSTGEWDSTAILITGDHSWRTVQLWHDGVDWSHEEEVASQGGEFDPRPAWILKLPNQHAPAEINAAVQATSARDLMRALLSGRIHSVPDLNQFSEHN